jgi:DNA gyrase subunit A
MNIDQYKSQNRGGVGVAGIKVHDDDYVEHIEMTSTHDYHMFFTNLGKVYKIKGYQIPEGSKQAKGLPLVNLLALDPNEKLAAMACIKNFDDEEAFITFFTAKGIVKRTPLSAYQNIRTNGIIAINLRDDDEIINVLITDGKKDFILGASNGKAIRFEESQVRETGRTAMGVKGMDLEDEHHIVGIAVIDETEQQDILVITENGYGKRTLASEYRRQQRGGKGVKTIQITEKNGALKTLTMATNEQDLMVVTDRGIIIRTEISQISTLKKATQGVRIIKLRSDQKVATIVVVPHQEIIEAEAKDEAYAHITLGIEDTQVKTTFVEPQEPEEVDSEEILEGDLFE